MKKPSRNDSSDKQIQLATIKLIRAAKEWRAEIFRVFGNTKLEPIGRRKPQKLIDAIDNLIKLEGKKRV